MMHDLQLEEYFQQALRPFEEARRLALEDLSDLEKARRDISNQIAEKRDIVVKAERMIRQIDPNRLPVKPKKATSSNSISISEEKLRAAEKFIRDWLGEQEHDTVTQVDLVLTGFSQHGASAAFRRLREEGVIRMVRQEGSRKHFRLTKRALGSEEQPEQEEKVVA